MKRALLLTGLATLALAAPAIAQDPPTNRPIASTRIAESLRIADAYWHRPAPCKVRVYAAAGSALDASVNPAELGGGRYTALEVAHRNDPREYPRDCNVWIADHLLVNTIAARIATCSYIVHALGHEHGLGHDPRPTSVMAPVNQPIVYGCYRRFLPRGRGAWWREHYGQPVFATWPGPEVLR